MDDAGLFLGIDLGTSGARAVVINAAGALLAEGRAPLAAFGDDPREPATWWAACATAVTAALAQVDARRIRALAVDGTSGTLLAVDAEGQPLGTALMYDDLCTDAALLQRIAAHAPDDSAARGASGGLARALRLMDRRPARILHQADWIAGQFSGQWVSDANNSLKTGHDPRQAGWPDWIAATGLDPGLLPPVLEPGEPVGAITAAAARRFGLPAATLVVAGTTDGCASFLATGADRPGEGVTVLGSTLTLKMLADVPIFAPEYGIYSHRIAGRWLVGGASNTGGAVLARYFDPEALSALSARIDPETDSGLDYYPLNAPGERFPLADATLAPRLTPRPPDDARFLQGLFEGMAAIEDMGYRRLAALGAPALRAVRTVGGGAGNAVWTRLRERRLGVPMLPAVQTEAAYGTALLARSGAQAA
jgi:sugar (pentulose or hexulose) kinase